MEKKTVFVKTKEGEEAMRQRTRLVQRNLRNILIMVDGRATVEELSKRFGDQHAAETALAELEAGGFIAKLQDRLDFTQAVPAAASGEQAEDLPVLTSRIASTPARAPAAEPAPTAAPPAIGEIAVTAPEYESLPPAIAPPAPPSGSAPLSAVRSGWLDRFKGLFSGAEKPAAAPTKRPATAAEEFEEELPGGFDLAPISRSGRFGWPMLVLLCVAGIAVLSVLTLLLYPYDRHLPDVERSASAMLGEPVKIGGIDFALLPQPHIALRNVTVGQEAHQLGIGSVRAMPVFLTLLGEKKVFRQVSLDHVAVKAAGLGRLARAKASAPAVAIRQLSLNGLSLSAGDSVLSGFHGDVHLDAGGAVTAIDLRNADGTLEIRLEPKGEAYLIGATGNAWKAPFKPVLTFQWLEVQGELRPDRLELGKIEARAYDGQLAGKATLGWGSGATLAADIELKRMNGEKLLAAVGSDLSAAGDVGVRLKLASRADNLGKLPEALHVAGTFEIGRGSVRGFDLVEAARSRAPTRGGETKFEQLTGGVECDPQACRLGNLRLASGLLTAGGSLGIQRAGSLSGALNTELRSSAATVRVPLTVGGSAKDPVLAPARGR